MNNTDVEAPRPVVVNKPKLAITCKLQIWLVDWNVVPGSTKILTQETIVLGEIMFTRGHYLEQHVL